MALSKYVIISTAEELNPFYGILDFKRVKNKIKRKIGKST